MSDYILLAAALTFAVPYAYLTVAINVIQPRQVATYVTVVGLLTTWHIFASMSFMQVVPVLAMSAWWWANNFSAENAIREPLRFNRSIPVGLRWLVLATVLASVFASVFAWFFSEFSG
jgi:hypothetical protein